MKVSGCQQVARCIIQGEICAKPKSSWVTSLQAIPTPACCSPNLIGHITLICISSRKINRSVSLLRALISENQSQRESREKQLCVMQRGKWLSSRNWPFWDHLSFSMANGGWSDATSLLTKPKEFFEVRTAWPGSSEQTLTHWEANGLCRGWPHLRIINRTVAWPWAIQLHSYKRTCKPGRKKKEFRLLCLLLKQKVCTLV